MNPRNHKMNVLITGATGGIGGAIAARFHRAGMNVCLHYSGNLLRAEELADSLSEDGSDGFVRIFRADFTKPETVEEMFREIEEEVGEIDVLINNAGVSAPALLTDITYEAWRRTFSVNVDAVFLCTKAVLPGMIRRKFGKIVNVSSMWGQVGASCEVDYSASKAAVIGFTKALAKEVGPSGINVNCVAPGVIDTPMNGHLTKADLEALTEETPLERLGTPYDVAETVFFLCSAGASFLTGQVIGVNGGFVI